MPVVHARLSHVYVTGNTVQIGRLGLTVMARHPEPGTRTHGEVRRALRRNGGDADGIAARIVVQVSTALGLLGDGFPQSAGYDLAVAQGLAAYLIDHIDLAHPDRAGRCRYTPGLEVTGAHLAAVQ